MKRGESVKANTNVSLMTPTLLYRTWRYQIIDFFSDWVSDKSFTSVLGKLHLTVISIKTGLSNWTMTKLDNFSYTMLPATKQNCLAISGYSKPDLKVQQHHLMHKLRVTYICHFCWKDACLLRIDIYDVLDKFLLFTKVYIFSVVVGVSQL